MAIRSAAKALIVREGAVLLVRCVNESGHVHYDLPGGGQHQYETLEEAVVRECLEETGYLVTVVRFAALAEEIYDDRALRERYPDYTHRIHHIFLAEILGGAPDEATETDFHQASCDWVPVGRMCELDIRPTQLRDALERVLSSDSPVYLGTVHVR